MTLVVGYNGRKPSRPALAWAADEAARRDTPLLVVYAANYPGMNIDPGPGLLDPDPGALDAAQEVTARGVAEALVRQPGLQVSGATEVTSPARALVEAGRGAGLLVVGTRGRGPAAGALLGSVSFNVAAAASCPVVVVKGGPRQRPVGSDRHVVVGTDGSAHAEAAVDFAAEQADRAGAALEVVCCTGADPATEPDPHILRANAERIAGRVSETLQRTRPTLVVRARVEEGPAGRALVAASADAGMVVLGTRGRGAFHGWLLGSVSHAVIHGAACPVAVCPREPG